MFAGTLVVGAQEVPSRPPVTEATQAGTQEDGEAGARRGILVGGFFLNAGGEAGFRYDDNIFATPRGKVDDLIAIIAPFVSIRSGWARHEIVLDAGATIGRYLDNSAEDFEDYSVGGEGRYDLGGGSNLFGGARFSREHESRESTDDVSGRVPTIYRKTDTFAGTNLQFGALNLRLGGTFERYDFDDVAAGMGGRINNDDRDRNIFEAGSRIGYRVSREFEPFLQFAANWRRYDLRVDDFGFDRDSRGLGAALGTRFFLGPRLEGEVLAGFMRQSYQDGAFRTRTVADFGGRLNWRVARGTRLRLNVDRSIEETTVVGSSGDLNTTGSMTLEHAIARDLVISASASYGNSKFAEVRRFDKLASVGTGLKYFVTPNVYAAVDYQFIRRESNVPAGNYDENLVYFRLGAELANLYREVEDDTARDWGFYGGAQASFGQVGTRLTGPRGAGGSLAADFGDSGWGGGGFVGYGVTLNSFYFGLEADAEGNSTEWRHARLPGGRVFGVEKGASYGGSVRIGTWLPYGALVYGRVGVVRTRFDTDYQTASGREFDRTDRKYGIRGGGGIEAPLTNRSFLRLDYTYTDYQDYEVVTPSATDRFENNESLLRVGVGYRLQDLPGRDTSGDRPRPRFAGFYGGVQGGYGTLDTINEGPRQAGSTLEADRAGSGPQGGVFAGYGAVFAGIYLGAEIDAGYSGIDWSISRDPDRRIYSVDQRESFGAGARIGYVFDGRTLVYGRVGVTRTKFDTEYSNGGVFSQREDTMTGLRVGGGVEVPATEHVFLRFEFNHLTALDTYSVDYNGGTDTFRNRVSNLSVGVGYRF
ncbi:MAG: outer membrane beta-barrel protein [Alphaproteobacteria bacterium]|nr:outer membrane beta-barrel protein [Alphaproteobacteria bacterium]